LRQSSKSIEKGVDPGITESEFRSSRLEFLRRIAGMKSHSFIALFPTPTLDEAK
jgi:hypothetical protein